MTNLNETLVKVSERVRPTKEQWMAIELDEQIPMAYESIGKISDILGDDFLEEHDLDYRIWAWEDKGDLMLSKDGGNTHCGVIAYMYGDSITIIQNEFSDDAIDAALVKAISSIKTKPKYLYESGE